MSEEKIVNVIFGCLVGVVVFLSICIINYDSRKTNEANARLHAACGSLTVVSTFYTMDKRFVVCSPEYVSSPNDFVIREVKESK